MATPTTLLRFVALFVPAGLCEIDGGWLIRNWLRNDRPCRWGLLGGLVLIPYGVIPTLQTSHFGRAYVAHGGFFVLLSLLWGQGLDSDRPHPSERGVEGRVRSSQKSSQVSRHKNHSP